MKMYMLPHQSEHGCLNYNVFWFVQVSYMEIDNEIVMDLLAKSQIWLLSARPLKNPEAG